MQVKKVIERKITTVIDLNREETSKLAGHLFFILDHEKRLKETGCDSDFKFLLQLYNKIAYDIA